MCFVILYGAFHRILPLTFCCLVSQASFCFLLFPFYLCFSFRFQSFALCSLLSACEEAEKQGGSSKEEGTQERCRKEASKQASKDFSIISRHTLGISPMLLPTNYRWYDCYYYFYPVRFDDDEVSFQFTVLLPLSLLPP